MIDILFYSFSAALLLIILSVLTKLRHRPIYEPRVLFSLASLAWFSILHGYNVGYENYLAFESISYYEDIYILSLFTILLFLLGYITFIVGASVKYKFVKMPKANNNHININLIRYIAYFCVFVAFCNFAVNVFLVSGGSVLDYLMSTAGRSYQIKEGKGVSTLGYMLGHIGVCVIAYLYAERPRRFSKLILFILIFTMLIIKASQGRVFQSLVLLGAFLFSYSLGKKVDKGFVNHIKYLLLFVVLGLSMYFLRIASALYYQGLDAQSIPLDSVVDSLIHFAFERGNLPNVPVVLTIIDKVPNQDFFMAGGSIFNWLIGILPPELLPSDFLVSLWIKNQWYLDIDGGGLPPTAVGEWYLNFGWLGVGVGMFLVGHILGNVYHYVKMKGSVFSSVIWSNLAFGFIIIYPKTDLSQVPTFTIVFCIIFYFLCYFFNRVISNEKL